MKILTASRVGSSYVPEFIVINKNGDLGSHPPMGECFEKPDTYELGTFGGYYEISKVDMTNICFHKAGAFDSRKVSSLYVTVRGEETPNSL